MRRRLVLAMSFVLVSAFVVSTAQAVPGFTRKYDMSCNQCHSPWPNLNAFGRNFKENGYRMDAGSEAPDHLQEFDTKAWLEKLSFISGKLNGRLYDKKEADDEFRLRTIHEIELFIAGHAGNNFSFFSEAEAEDEDDFNLFVAAVAAGWHPRAEANFVAGYGPLFFADPYNSLADGGRRMTRSHKVPLDKGFEGASFRLRKPTQFFTFYGRAKDFFYSATIASGNSDPEGEDAKDLALRVAYDFPVVTAGAFYIDGSMTDGLGVGMDQDWTRVGVDFQVEKNGFSAYGMWMEAESDDPGPPLGEFSNDSAYVEALYVFDKDGNPMWYPVLRWETFESMNGVDSIDAIALMVGCYIRQNININLEYWKQTSVPTGMVEDDRVTLFFNIGF